MSHVFVVDAHKKPLNPVHPGRARLLLSSGKAAVFKRYPFTLILKTAVETPIVQPVRVKLDPGAQTTGIAVVNDRSGKV
ncbi:MAG TPA: RRXRR domain-containing protein, partial [Ktedonobacteraceae bacterium]|nr:RRXRR domain-containing protein [Ktedonobacteraceae bacterium]